MSWVMLAIGIVGTNIVYYVDIYTSACSSFQLQYLYLYQNYVYIYAMVYKFITVYNIYIQEMISTTVDGRNPAPSGMYKTL